MNITAKFTSSRLIITNAARGDPVTAVLHRSSWQHLGSQFFPAFMQCLFVHASAGPQNLENVSLYPSSLLLSCATRCSLTQTSSTPGWQSNILEFFSQSSQDLFEKHAWHFKPSLTQDAVKWKKDDFSSLHSHLADIRSAGHATFYKYPTMYQRIVHVTRRTCVLCEVDITCQSYSVFWMVMQSFQKRQDSVTNRKHLNCSRSASGSFPNVLDSNPTKAEMSSLSPVFWIPYTKKLIPSENVQRKSSPRYPGC